MIRFRFTYDKKALDSLIDLYESIPSKAILIMRDRVRPFVDEQLNRRLRTPPQRVSGFGMRWTPSRNEADSNKTPNTPYGYYSRQKAAFYATRGFGMGIPTRRTGGIPDSWFVRARYTEDKIGEINVRNTDPRSHYVVGDYQQDFHRIHGWPRATQVLREIMLTSQEMLVEELGKMFEKLGRI